MKVESFTRRKFLRLGLATGAAVSGGALWGLPGWGDFGDSNGAPTDFYRLEVGYSTRKLGGYWIKTRT
jgi:hypothetical protein